MLRANVELIVVSVGDSGLILAKNNSGGVQANTKFNEEGMKQEAFFRAMYSASMVETATTSCCLELHEMRPLQARTSTQRWSDDQRKRCPMSISVADKSSTVVDDAQSLDALEIVNDVLDRSPVCHRGVRSEFTEGLHGESDVGPRRLQSWCP
ncbi:hypothetical protein Mapa_007779 [Marchantia paleacea]|nr:hypothetical protein Mapa_007779 [Marchantia paleacea]